MDPTSVGARPRSVEASTERAGPGTVAGRMRRCQAFGEHLDCPAMRHLAGLRVPFLLVALGALVAGCGSTQPSATGPITAGTVSAPREVNIIARDYRFDPAPVDLVPGETVLLHVIDAGLEVHEVVIGDDIVQAAWESAEAATAGAPPGPTPLVSVAPGVGGLRLVVHSGERVDVTWTVPTAADPLVVGCHIPGHWAKGMQVPVRFVSPGG
jgi:uncharacterized cupredoxin-like copper-binding protein